MSTPFTRRDFLKLASVLPLGYISARMARSLNGEKQNVLVIVFDAWSARNISLYGYGRGTTPNLARLAERAIVYHNHHAGGNFTTPGTASLLTGALPWSHRAFELNAVTAPSFARKNLFHAFPDHQRIAYTHNSVADFLLEQFSADIDEWIPRPEYFLTNDAYVGALFGGDEDIAAVSWVRIIKKADQGYAYSLFLSRLYELLQGHSLDEVKELFPRGLPAVNGDNYFILEQAIDALEGRVGQIARPFLGYFHFLPPHYPYRTRREFNNFFKGDGFQVPEKPTDLFSGAVSSDTPTATSSSLLDDRRHYDEFVLYVDQEFGRFFNLLEASGILDDTWLVLTSDHGEMFERGIGGHATPVLYEPVIHVPLMIFEPGRRERMDIHTPTSAVDLLPTLLHVTGQPPAPWTEGLVLPPFADLPPGRSVHAIEARNTPLRGALTEATVTHIRGHYKLMYFFGYPELKETERIELYDLEADPEELHDLSASQPELTRELLDELKAKLAEVDLQNTSS
jgi:arylsulfatase A-like enzyme